MKRQEEDAVTPTGYIRRPTVPADAAIIAAQREAMFTDMGVEYREEVAQFTPWVERHLEAGKYVGWLFETGGEVVAGAGLLLLDWPPHFVDPQPLRSYLLNVYVHPDHRGQGLARQLTETAIAETRQRGIRILSLHASEFGRPLYEKLGFTSTNEMRLMLENP
ncbi:GNAT family N-acetyltransferase [Deinococcus sp. KNUC1210]|uniref:GNAT family N-acetyltransferase n=1 Tax=Deinococcus sp. KNUC1210 TaxID=2917691 RepID=UPI001EF11147|nr:GNAT family N-acetyltransferase [Deinococcus sp. KNUC1210]ULH14571.1 GNAT family N-acetyltransferase [Deinococcus sp. KNUC1210]